VDERSRRIAARFEWPMIVAALLVIPVLVIEGSTDREPWTTIAAVLNWSIWLAFAVELVVMLIVVPRRGAWLRAHPLEVAIVLLTVPLLPTSLEAARAFRLLRLLPLVASATRMRRLLSLEGVRDAAILSLFVVLGGGAAFSAVESTAEQPLSTWDGVWWAVTTVTTVGYGDVYPETDGGRVIAIVVMLAGIGFVALLTAAAADRFIASGQARSRELEDLRSRVDRLERANRPPA
jgi:voltage-gated potassium channel